MKNMRCEQMVNFNCNSFKTCTHGRDNHEYTKDCDEYICEATEKLAKCILVKSTDSSHGCYYGYGQNESGKNVLIYDLEFFKNPNNKTLFIFKWCPICGKYFDEEHIEKIEHIIYENTKIKEN